MRKKERVEAILAGLAALYPDALCSLVADDPWELLVSVRLSAQCTDARVNLTTPALFARFPTPQAMSEADVTEIEELVRPCGYYRQKAKNIREMSAQLIERFGGRVPDTMEELLTLPGVGRKTANLILGDVYGKPAIVADTHCIRISGRLGLTDGTKDPTKVELQLKKIIPPEKGSDFCHRLVLFGRDVCTARSPRCGTCPLAEVCPGKQRG